jgi:hypothetical protein
MLRLNEQLEDNPREKLSVRARSAGGGGSAADIVAFARERLRFDPDPVQEKVLRTESKRVLLNCTRQWGKSVIAAV